MKLTTHHLILSLLILGSIGGLLLRNLPFTQGNLDTDAPPLRTSYDVFANTEHIKWIYDSEQSYYLSPARAGGIPHAINAQNPLYYILIATFSKLTTIPTYQTTYLVLNILSLLVILVIYLLIEKTFDAPIALVTAFFGFFLHAYWLFPMYIGFQYDYHTYALLAGVFFFIIYLFSFAKKTIKEDLFTFTLLGTLLAGITLSHYSELFFYIPFITLALAYILYYHRTYTFLTKVLIFSIPFFIFSTYFLYYYPLTLNVHLTGGITGQIGNQINPERAKHVEYFPWPRFTPTLNILSLAGTIILAILFLSRKIDTKRTLVILTLLTILFVGTSNYTLNVWANRAERQLFLGHSFFVFLPALGIVGTAMLLSGNNKRIVLGISLLTALLIPYFLFTDTYNALQDIAKNTYFDDNKWNTLHWIRDNTPQEARVFFLAGYIHEFQMLAERVELKGDLNLGHTRENILQLCNQQWPDTVVGDWGFRDPPSKGFLTKRTGWNTFEYALPFQNTTHPYPTIIQRDNVSLSFFDYIVFQHKNTEGYDSCVQWFLQESLTRNYTLAYQNPTMTIIHKP